MFTFHTLPLVLIITGSTQSLLQPPSIAPKYDSDLVCLTKILKKLPKTIVHVFGTRSETNLPEILARMPRIIVTVRKPIRFSLVFRAHYVIYASQPDQFNETLRLLRSSPIWSGGSSPRGRSIVVTAASRLDGLRHIFTALCGADMVRTVVLVGNRIYTSRSCLNPNETAIESSSCSDRNFDLTLRSGLRRKQMNLNGIKLKLYLHKSRVFPTLVDPSLRPNPGILISLVRLIGERTNAIVSFPVRNLTNVSIVDRTGSDIRMVYFLSRDNAEFELYDQTHMIFRDEIVWVVPKPERISTVKVVTSVFTVTSWAVIFAVFLTVAGFYHVLAKVVERKSYRATFARTALLIFGISLGNSSSCLRPRASVLRFLTLFYIFYCMHVYTAFQTNMVSLLLNPGTGRGIESIEEMTDSPDLVPIVSRLAYKQLNKSESPLAGPIHAKCVVSVANITGNLFSVAYYRNSSTHIGEQILRMYKKERDMVRVLEENAGLLDIEVSFGLRKGHPFLGTLNRFIRIVKENGLLEKWFLDVGMFKYAESSGHEDMVVSMEHLRVVLVFWVIGLCLAVAVFVAEMVSDGLSRVIRSMPKALFWMSL